PSAGISPTGPNSVILGRDPLGRRTRRRSGRARGGPVPGSPQGDRPWNRCPSRTGTGDGNGRHWAATIGLADYPGSRRVVGARPRHWGTQTAALPYTGESSD